MERSEVDVNLSSIEQLRRAYRYEIALNEDPEFADDLADLIDFAERWLLRQIEVGP